MRSKTKVVSLSSRPQAAGIFDCAQQFLNIRAANENTERPMPVGLCILLWLVLASAGWGAFDLAGSAF